MIHVRGGHGVCIKTPWVNTELGKHGCMDGIYDLDTPTEVGK